MSTGAPRCNYLPLVRGEGGPAHDRQGEHVVYVYDSLRFPFFRAEAYHQFHRNAVLRRSLPPWYTGALKQQQVADRNELSATRERLRQSEETARIAQAVCDRVRVEASDEHGATPRDPGNKCLISRDLTTPHLIGSYWIFGPILDRKIDQNRPKIGSKRSCVFDLVL